MTNILLLVLFFVFLVLNFGRRVSCPDCGALLPLFQSPFTKTRRQWIAGGYLCQRCGCETNMAGEKVTTDMPAARLSRINALFLACALLAAVELNATVIFGGTLPAAIPSVPAEAATAASPQFAPSLESHRTGKLTHAARQ